MKVFSVIFDMVIFLFLLIPSVIGLPREIEKKYEFWISIAILMILFTFKSISDGYSANGNIIMGMLVTILFVILRVREDILKRIKELESKDVDKNSP